MATTPKAARESTSFLMDQFLFSKASQKDSALTDLNTSDMKPE